MFKPRNELNGYFSLFYIFSFVWALVHYGADISWLYSYGIHFFVISFGIAFGYHKVIIHKAIQTWDVVIYASAVVGLFSNTGSALTWATSHYLHHAFPDTENDPHSPLTHQYRILFGFYNTDAIMKNQKKVFAAVRGIVKWKFLVHLHNYYYIYFGSYMVIALVFGGIKGLLFWGVIPSGLSFYSILFTNYFNHGSLGYRNFETKDRSQNVWFLFFFTFGENWHNNHHQYPSATSNRIRWWEVDIPAIYCKIFSKDNFIPLSYFVKRFQISKGKKARDYVY